MKYTLSLIVLSAIVFSCREDVASKKNEVVLEDHSESVDQEEDPNAIKPPLINRPSVVLTTGAKKHRLVPEYREKLTRHRDSKKRRRYIDGTYHHRSYRYHEVGVNNWHNHFMPGLEAAYGFNMFNVAHYDMESKEKNYLFEKSVLVKTLYYPAEEPDTLNGTPVERDFYLVSVYNEDTNHDGRINAWDLRRFFRFDMDGKNQKALIPANYSVLSSQYDDKNDVMYVYARHDKNDNGLRDKDEEVHIFWLDLKNPGMGERLY